MKTRILPALSYGSGAALLIIAAAVLRIAYLFFWCPLDLSPDEAHYWDWSRHLDWSYYSKGPLVACLIRLGCWLFGDPSVAVTGTQMAAVRLPAVICSSLLLWGLYRLTTEVHGKPQWGFAVIALALTTPLISAGAYLMTIDAPFLCAWMWALVWCYRALFVAQASRQRTWAWVAAGICLCLGILAKHTMVLFVPMLGIFLLVARYYPENTGTQRTDLHLFQKGFWLMAGLGALGGLPILIWNFQNDWVTLQHTRGHAGVDHPIQWLGPLRYLAIQAALLLGYWFVTWLAGVWCHRPGRETNPRIGYLWWMSVPIIVFFALFSFKNGGGEPNWPIAGYLAGVVLFLPMLAGFLTSNWLPLRYFSRTCLVVFCGLGLLLSVAVHDSRLFYPLLTQLAPSTSGAHHLPMRRLDPTCRLKGWRTLAGEVEVIREGLRREGIEPVIACGSWAQVGEMGFYISGQPVVYCLGPVLGERHSQYDLWHPNPIADEQLFLGKTFILVGIHELDMVGLFDAIEPTRYVLHRVENQPLADWNVTVGRGLRGGWRKKCDRY